MAKVYNRLQIDVNTRPSAVISAVQKDAKSRYLDVVLLDGAMALNLTGHEVRIYGRKGDGKEFYNNGEITDATAGRCQFELTDQALAVAQDLQVQIILFKENREVLSTHAFTIHVVQSLFATNAVESSNEYGALVVLYQNLYEAYDLMTDMVQNMGAKGVISTARGLNTFWQGMEYLAKYMDTDLRGKLDLAIANASVQGVLNVLGTTTNTGGTATSGTVMGKLNGVIKTAAKVNARTKSLTTYTAAIVYSSSTETNPYRVIGSGVAHVSCDYAGTFKFNIDGSGWNALNANFDTNGAFLLPFYFESKIEFAGSCFIFIAT